MTWIVVDNAATRGLLEIDLLKSLIDELRCDGELKLKQLSMAMAHRCY